MSENTDDLSGLEGYVETVRKFGVTDNSRSNYWVTPERAVLALAEPLRRLDEWEKGLVIQGLWDQKERIEELETRLPCGCPNIGEWEQLDPCPGHVWTHWHPHAIDALSECRFCFYCGSMETQTLDTEAKP